MHSRPSVLVALLGLTVAAAACGGSGSPAGALEGKTPAQILTAGIKAAEAQTSVHYVLQASGQSQSQTITGDAGRNEGIQTVQTGSDQVEVEVVGDKAYLQGNAGGLEHTIGLPSAAASQYAGRWISVSPSDTLYGPITQAVTLHGIFTQLTPSGSLVESTPGLVSGHEVIGVRGGLPGTTQGGVTGDAVLYVSTASATLPVGFTGQATSANKKVTDVGTFAHWGEALHLTAPSGAVPYSSIPKS